MMEAVIVAIIAALSGLGGGLGGWLVQRRGQRDDTTKWLTGELRDDAKEARSRLDQLEQLVSVLRAELVQARDEIHALQQARRIYDVPANAQPMSTFPIATLNEVENERGWHVAIHLDDGPGTTATGWVRVPISQRPPAPSLPPTDHANGVRSDHA